MDLTKQQQLFAGLTPQQQDTINFYHDNNMAMLRKICDPIIYRKGVSLMDYDELYDVASDTLLESLGTYDESKGSQFSTYLKGNINRAFYDWTRDNRRFKRCNLTEERDENGNLAKDKNGKQKYVVIADISIDAPIGDDSESTLADMLPSGFDLEAELAEEIGISDDERVQKYLSSLSNIQRQIVEMKMTGVSGTDIKKKLQISNSEYEDNMKSIRENRLICMFNKNSAAYKQSNLEGNKVELNVLVDDAELVMDLDTTDNYRRDTNALKSLLDEKAEGELDCNYVSQRAPFQWDEEQTNKYFSRILNNQPIPEIVVCETFENGKKVSYLVEGLQRLSYAEEFRENRMPVKAKGAEFTKIKYKKYEYKSDGSKVLDENGRAKFTIDIFDITNKYYRDLPEFLQKRFDNFNFTVTRYFNCTYDIIDYHIRNYNNHVSMTTSHYGITSVSNKTSSHIKEITHKHSFFLNVAKCTNKKKKQGGLEDLVARAMMSTFFLDNWKKDLIDTLKYIDSNASDEQFEQLKSNLDRIEKIADKSVQDLFNITNGHIWIAVFDKFAKLEVDDNLFTEFMRNFKESLHSKKIKGRSYDDVSTRNTKDKSTVKNKIDVLIDLMMDFLHIEESETEKNKLVPEQFIAENVGLDIESVRNDMDFYNQMLDDLEESTIKIGSKLLHPNNRLSLLALVAYSIENEKDLDEWMLEYAKDNNTYFMDQEKNYLHMKQELEKYLNKKGAAA